MFNFIVSTETVIFSDLTHDVTKIQAKKMSILPRCYFHDVLGQLKLIFIQIFSLKGFLVL